MVGDRGRQAFGITRLLLARKRVSLEERLPALLMALQVLLDDRTFDRRDTTSLPEYVIASRDLASRD